MLSRVIITCAVAMLIASTCTAQFKKREVSGEVTDARGNALPHVAVQLENTANLSVRSYITGKDGRYHFDGLRDDVDFTLRAKYKNWWSKPATVSKFNESTHPEVNLVIPID